MRGRRPIVPPVVGPTEAAGRTTTGAVLGPGAGDNAAAALGSGGRAGGLRRLAGHLRRGERGR